MNANELMLGDWVHVKAIRSPLQRTRDFIGKINEVDGLNCMVGIDKSSFDYDELESISLTPEILERNGFVKVPHEYEYPECQCWTNDVDGNYSFEIVTDEHRKPYILGNGDMGDYEWVNFECKYVHELQHALKLCGIEKEIVL